MTFYLFSLGCKVNSYECSSLAMRLIELGYKEDNNNPDVVIINTCSVTSVADQKSRQHIRKMRKSFPSAVLVVMGCYSQGNYEYIKDNTDADIIVGTSNRSLIPSLIDEFLLTHQKIVKVESNTRSFDYEEMGVTSFTDNVRAYLKIQDGCDNFCSYCIIPYMRGRMRSRNFDNIILEAKNLVNSGYKEIILSGIHVGGYGKDLKDTTFSSLVEALLNIPNLYRLRISSIEESEIDDKLIELLKTKDNLAKHLHIPLQSGSDTVLKRMNRKYDKSQFLAKINKIKKACPDVALTTDVIVGFPSESEEEFLECYDFIKECGFNMLHVFPFSSRSGTPASKMEGQISSDIKKKRSDILLNLSKELWNQYTDKYIDKHLTILIENIKDNICTGHSSNYISYSFNNDNYQIGDIVDIVYKK